MTGGKKNYKTFSKGQIQDIFDGPLTVLKPV